MAKKKTAVQNRNGWFVSQDEYLAVGLPATRIYSHLDGEWKCVNTGNTPVKPEDLPEPPAEMWPLQLVTR